MSLAPGRARIWPEEGSSWSSLIEHPVCQACFETPWCKLEEGCPKNTTLGHVYQRDRSHAVRSRVIWAWVLHGDVKALWRKNAFLSQERIHLPCSLLNFIPQFCWLSHWGSFARSTISFLCGFTREPLAYDATYRDFPGDPVRKTPGFHCRGRGFNPWLGKIPQAIQNSQKVKNKIKIMLHRPKRRIYFSPLIL